MTNSELSSPPSTADPLRFAIKAELRRFDTREDIEPFLKPLIENPDVEEVHLSGNTYGIEACKCLGQVLATKKKLKVAQFADIFSTRLRTEIPMSLTYLLTAILHHPNLHTVNLSDNAFGSTAQVPLITFLSSHLPLEHLILANNGLGPEAGSNIAQALATLGASKKANSTNSNTSSSPPPLKTIICGRNRLGDASMKSWAKCYSMNTSLETIRMPQNGIRPDDIAILLREGIVWNKGLKILDLQDNTFTVRGSRALAQILPELTELTDLGIGDCLLSSRGGVAIAEALAKGNNKKLEFLRLQYNELTAHATTEFIKAVKSDLPALKRIELNGNKFDEDDQFVTDLRDIFRSRGYGELDELDDMEEPDSEEEEEEEVSIEEEELHEDLVRPNAARDVINKQAEEAEEEEVAQEKDKDTDELADILAKTHIAE